MTKSDRAKMYRRLEHSFLHLFAHLEQIEAFVALEVTRAVRAERKARCDTEEIWASQRRRSDEQMIERAKGLGRKRL